MTRLPINTFNFIGGIVAAVVTALMLPLVYLSVWLYYGFGGVMLITNVVGLLQMKKLNGKLTGNILGIVAGSLHFLSGLFALPAMILYILSSIYCAKDKITN